MPTTRRAFLRPERWARRVSCSLPGCATTTEENAMDLDDLDVDDRIEIYTPSTGTYWGYVT
ncbi:hypothetical protein Ato02nite_005770 [Paractinoplanes toevensis]|uniref:Uncharacterized protein n=1 Tax=Paractinoplanes toevensis TaxID=571911 RepID=A0A919T6S4_9ACTN|nr:hypothetical protein Ato02nite_005770 [Actinoplanes toevensis]